MSTDNPNPHRAPYDIAPLTDHGFNAIFGSGKDGAPQTPEDFGGILGDVPHLPEGWTYPERAEHLTRPVHVEITMPVEGAPAADRVAALRYKIDNQRQTLARLQAQYDQIRASSEGKLREQAKRLAALDLTFATLCDMVLGEDAADRNDAALVRAVGEMKRERDAVGAVLASQSRNACVSGGTPTLTERAANKRIAELERERDTAKTNALTCLQMMEQAQNERDASNDRAAEIEAELASETKWAKHYHANWQVAQQSRARLVGAIRRWREIDRAFEKRSLMQVLDENKTLSAKLQVLTEERNLLLNSMQGQMGSDLREWQEKARQPKTRQPKTRHICVWISPRHIVNHSKILLDGVDITHRCFAADEESGTAWCWKQDADGRFVLVNWGKPATEVLRGKVEIVVDESFTTDAPNGWVGSASVGRAEL